MYGPCAGRRHDGFMLGESNMRERLRHLSDKWGREMCFFGDKGYSPSEEIQVPYKGSHLTEEQRVFNNTMSQIRATVEYGFMAIALDFAIANYETN
ncbi:hypothetical protein RvY_08764 [Ramazzottius varieornatus]|uniref:DDE Tnp4 domain-containing protein n=1 Tax=Ramazzottius varieornatus TaxID=947166 RepID=A0A1D1VG65_RAMVA|nr:hypothetical protein RvY_08764 [Ramazzottius varieornatus]